MAKKKKRFVAKQVNKPKTVKVVEPSVPVAKADNFFPTAYMLNIVASIIVLVASILFVIFPAQVGGFSGLPEPKFASLLGVLDIVIGLAMLISSAFMKVNLREGTIFVLAFGILAFLFTPHGFVIGPLIGIVTSIVVLAKIR